MRSRFFQVLVFVGVLGVCAPTAGFAWSPIKPQAAVEDHAKATAEADVQKARREIYRTYIRAGLVMGLVTAGWITAEYLHDGSERSLPSATRETLSNLIERWGGDSPGLSEERFYYLVVPSLGFVAGVGIGHSSWRLRQELLSLYRNAKSEVRSFLTPRVPGFS